MKCAKVTTTSCHDTHSMDRAMPHVSHSDDGKRNPDLSFRSTGRSRLPFLRRSAHVLHFHARRRAKHESIGRNVLIQHYFGQARVRGHAR